MWRDGAPHLFGVLRNMMHATNVHGTCIETTGHREILKGERSFVCGSSCPDNAPVVVVTVTPGQAAYEMTATIDKEVAARNAEQFEDWIPWSMQSRRVQHQWERVAHAVIKQVMNNAATRCYCAECT